MNNFFNPLVTIVIPVYNGSNYLREAIDSALAQTYKNLEVLVINDGSNDGGKTKEIAESYGNRIRYFEKENGGVSTALNLGIREMKGEYFSWLSHDDVYYPNKIEEQIGIIRQQRNKEIILYSDYDIINRDSEYIKTWKTEYIEPFRILLLYSWPINGCTTLIKRSILLRNNLFDKNAKYSQDYQLWFKLAKTHKFVHIKKSLLKSRIHDVQGTILNNTTARIEIEAMYRSFIDTLFYEEEYSALYRYRVNIINGLKRKTYNNLVVYYINYLLKSNMLDKNVRIKMVLERCFYIVLIIKDKLIQKLKFINN